MAINDYVPKFDGISEFVPQMYQAINETARNTGQIRKATADTTAHGWAALQKAFTDFAEQGLQERGLNLKEKDIAATEKYRAGDLAQRAASEFGAEGRAKAERELRYHELAAANKRADLEAKNRLAIAGTQAAAKEKPDKNLLNKLFIDTVAPSGFINDQGLVPFPKWKEYAAMVPEQQAIGQFTATLDSNNITDPRMRAQYTQVFKDWYQTGKAPEQPGEGKAAPNALRPNPNDQMGRQAAAVQAEIDRTKVPFGATPAEKRQIQEKLDGLAARLKELQPRASVSAFD